MKLLFDENLSFRIVARISDLYPESAHVRDFDLLEAGDEKVWEFAHDHGFAIVTKDKDFVQRVVVYGHPPKVILLQLGNCSTSRIETALRSHFESIRQFGQNDVGILIVRS